MPRPMAAGASVHPRRDCRVAAGYKARVSSLEEQDTRGMCRVARDVASYYSTLRQNSPAVLRFALYVLEELS